MSKGIVAPKNKLGVKKSYNNNKGELCVDLQNMQYYWDVWKSQQKYQNYKVSIIFTKMFHLIHIISGSFDISDSESDQSGKTTESRNENESEPEETNPLMRLHVMSEKKSNWKNESHGQEEIKDEKEKSSKLIHWISILLLRIKLQYNLSNILFTVLLNLIYFIFFVLRHPLHLLFPKIISELELIANLKVLNKTKISAVCPNPKCACLYSIDEISCKVNGKLKAEICKKKLWGKRCNTELSFQKNYHLVEPRWFLIQDISIFTSFRVD